MNIALLGSGGREHAFAKQLAASPLCSNLYILPGNAGTRLHGTNVEISLSDFEAIGHFCLTQQIELVVVGPEDPLVNGLRNYFEADAQLAKMAFVGPDAAGAQMEGSKDWSKQFMQKYGIPTAKFKTFEAHNLEDGLAYIENHPLPIVLKADGLAAGKGVLICETHLAALQELRLMIAEKKFGSASSKVVIEEFLPGIELSVFVLTDGKNYMVLPTAKDYKRIGEGDTGLNTGGMGAISPVPFADAAFMQKVETQIIIPTIKGLQAENIQYKGFIFIGLMAVNGEPEVIEYNCRMGDPETEVVLPRIENDLVALMLATAKGKLNEVTLKVDPRAAATIMLVSAGYPEAYEKGKEISGLNQVTESFVYHAGTKLGEDQKIYSNGGRVMAITSFGQTIQEAIEKSNLGAQAIQFSNKYYRKDIGFEFV